MIQILKTKKQKFENFNIDDSNLETSKDAVSYLSDINHPQFFPKKPLTSKIFFKIQFILSLFAFLFFLSIYLSYQFYLNKQEKLSHELVQNYSILKLYSSNSPEDSKMPQEAFFNSSESNSIIGTISIPKLEISYPVFSTLSDESLKISPCRFYGELPPRISNLCIAGHNYDNKQFFSQISHLKNGDIISFVDSFDYEFIYHVFHQYEVKANDLSPIYHESSEEQILTLITCNNFNKNRIVVKAKLRN